MRLPYRIKTFLLSLTYVLWIVPSIVHAQKADDDLLTKLRQAKDSNEDSLRYYYSQLLARTPKNQLSTVESGKLILADGLFKFNKRLQADSVFQTIDSAGLSSETTRIDYVIVKARLLQQSDREEKALTYLYQNIEKASAVQLAKIYMQIAFILRSSSDLANCTKFYRLAEAEAKKANNTGLQVRANMQLCKVFNGWVVVDLDSSVYYGEKAMKIAEKDCDDYWVTHAAAMAAAPLIRTGSIEKGKTLSKKALRNSETHSLDKLTIYYLLINLGFIYQKEQKYDSAIYFKEQAHNLRPTGIDHFRLEYSILKSQGKYKQALESLERYRSKYDSAKDKRHQTKVSNLQARFEAQQKEQEVQSLSQKSAIQQYQISQQRITLYGLAILILIIMVISYLLYQQRKQRDQRKRDNLEQRLLRLQMNPHFIYNALASIQNYVLQKKPLEASMYLAKFSSLMRQTLEHSRQEYISLEEEIETIDNYIKIQQLRYPQVDYSLEIDTEVDIETTNVPPMFVQPFIENAFEHGLSNKTHDAIIKIRIEKDSDNLLRVSIIDNGKGFSGQGKSNHKSLAIQIANERLSKYSRKFHQKLKVAISSITESGNKNKGTSVSLLMPYK